jgi:hypothetical protein
LQGLQGGLEKVSLLKAEKTGVVKYNQGSFEEGMGKCVQD